MLSMEDMRSYFKIDSTCPSGLRWAVNPPNLRRSIEGNSVGTLNKSGYYLLKNKGKIYGVHRIIYCLTHNKELDEIKYIDHVDGNKRNNHPDNLREADRSENQCNRTKGSNNTTGFKNVTYDGHGKYRVIVRKGSARFQQDSIESVDEAGEIARRVREVLHKEFAKE